MDSGEPGMTSFLVRAGIVKDADQARVFLIGTAIVALSAAAVIYLFLTPRQTNNIGPGTIQIVEPVVSSQ